MKFKVEPTEYEGVFVREMDTLTQLLCAEAGDAPDALRTRVGITLEACLVDAAGNRLYASPQEALTGVPAAAATPLYRKCLRLSDAEELVADAEKNSDAQG